MLKKKKMGGGDRDGNLQFKKIFITKNGFNF